jgi:hypothetical protein
MQLARPHSASGLEYTLCRATVTIMEDRRDMVYAQKAHLAVRSHSHRSLWSLGLGRDADGTRRRTLSDRDGNVEWRGRGVVSARVVEQDVWSFYIMDCVHTLRSLYVSFLRYTGVDSDLERVRCHPRHGAVR